MPTAKRPAANDPNAVTITDNQREILLQVFAGTEVDEIAAATGRKPSTIFNTLRTVRKQLGARNDFDLMRECLRRRIFKLSEIYRLTDALRRAQRAPAGRAPGG
jgi:DNA-binding CsgD family transcriptional regulator